MARKVFAIKPALLTAALAIPLTPNDGWKAIAFRSIPANRVEYLADGLRVQVDHSVGALVRPLERPLTVTAFNAELKISGVLPAEEGWPKDAYLRVGLILPGPHKPSFMERMLAPDWLRQLMKLAPNGWGIDKVELFELTPPTAALGQTRVFPRSKGLMRETVAAEYRAEPESFKFHYKLPKPLTTAGIWLSLDGDDTHSKFSIQLKKLEFDTAD